MDERIVVSVIAGLFFLYSLWSITYALGRLTLAIESIARTLAQIERKQMK